MKYTTMFMAVALFSVAALAEVDEYYVEPYDPYYDSDEYLDTLKDPRTRDEDLSQTVVTGWYIERPDGLYEYHYHVESPVENKGRILSFQLDISCDNPDRKGVGLIMIPGLSHDGKYVSVGAIDDDYNPRIGPRVSADNRAHWLANIGPGESKKYSLVSPEKPAYRTYILHPAVQTDGWDYSGRHAEFPWIEDWIATGTTIGPRCSTDDSPIPDNPPENGDDDSDPPDDDGGKRCHPGKGHAYGHEKGKGHSHSQGKHKGHSHDC